MSSSISLRLARHLSTSAAAASSTSGTSISISKAKSKLKSEHDPDKALKIYSSVSDHYTSPLSSRYAQEYTVKRLAKSHRFSDIEVFLESHKNDKKITEEPFLSSIIRSYGIAGMFDHALKTYHQMDDLGTPRSVVSFNVLLSACVNSKLYDRVPQLFDEMPKKHGFLPDKVSYGVLIRSFCEMGKAELAMERLKEMEKKGVEVTVVIYTTILHSLYKGGRSDEAERIWNEMAKRGCGPDVGAYNVKIMNIQGGDPEGVKGLIEEMSNAGLKPDTISYNYLMSCYCRNGLEFLKGRLTGLNKEDIEIAISLVEALAVKLTQNEGELIQEKFEVKKLVNFLKQASEDAKRLVNQERSFACAEIESARSVVQRIGEALDEEERNSPTSAKQEVEGLLEEVQEARRIKLLHQPSKVMDMEHELRALRIQIREKSTVSIKLQKELAMSRRAGQNKSEFYELTGFETLGSILRIQSCSDEAIDISKCSIQWYRLSSECSRREPIVGADKFVYAPEPIDVGRLLEADIVSNGQKVSLTTTAPIDPASGLGSYVETLLRKSNVEFSVVIAQMNGRNYSSRSAHCFHVGKTKLKLGKGWITKARDSYSGSMQLCGFRGGGNSAAKSLFWQPRKGHSFVLVFESEKERNGALMIARKYAIDCNVILAGPDDDALL